ncbi:hypothetical protein D3C77_572220 [compost metagenome]
MLRRFDQRQAKTLADRGKDQAGAGCVDLLKVFITDTLQPKQTLSLLRMVAQARNGFRNIAAGFVR